MLGHKWREKYNDVGPVRGTGGLCGSGLRYILGGGRAGVYPGVGAGALSHSLYEPAPTLLASLPQMPEWHLMTATLVAIATLSVAWSPLRLALPLGLAAILPSVAQACLGGARARFPAALRGKARLARRVLTAVLHLIQPVARLRGRIQEGLTPWRRRCPRRPGPLWPVTAAVWSEHWQDQDQRLRAMETHLRADGVCGLRGERDARWDLEVRGGSFGAARLLMGGEGHARKPERARDSRPAQDRRRLGARNAPAPGLSGRAAPRARYTPPPRHFGRRGRPAAPCRGARPGAGAHEQVCADVRRRAARPCFPGASRPTSPAALPLLSRLECDRQRPVPRPAGSRRDRQADGRR